jgi:hypothetical protein
MSRDLTAGMIAEVTARALQPIFIIKAEFDSGDLRLWTGIGDLTYDSEIYTGVGTILGMKEIVENQAVEASGLDISLSVIASSIISTALTENYQGRPITVWFGSVDDTGAVIVDPHEVFHGKMDVLEISEGADTCNVNMKCENETIELMKAKVRRYTSEDQKSLYSGDLAFDFVPSLQDKQLVWGRTIS